MTSTMSAVAGSESFAGDGSSSSEISATSASQPPPPNAPLGRGSKVRTRDGHTGRIVRAIKRHIFEIQFDDGMDRQPKTFNAYCLARLTDGNESSNGDDSSNRDSHSSNKNTDVRSSWANNSSRLIKKLEEEGSIDVVDKKSKTTLTWKFVERSVPDNPLKQHDDVGICNLRFDNMNEDSFDTEMFFHLWPGDPHQQHRNINHWISINKVTR